MIQSKLIISVYLKSLHNIKGSRGGGQVIFYHYTPDKIVALETAQ